MKNFQKFFAIDWTGAESPVRNRSLAVARACAGDGAPSLVETHDEKPWSRQLIADWIIDLARKGVRSLIGIDCNFSYARCVAVKQVGEDYSAADLWAVVDKASRPSPNYFAGGFWQHADYNSSFWLPHQKKPAWYDAKTLQRETERLCHEEKYGLPETPFKFVGSRQVGKGGLAGMRLIHDLKIKLGADIRIWPFDRDCYDCPVVLVEIYPRLFIQKTLQTNHKIRSYDMLDRALPLLGSRITGKSGMVADHDADALISAAGLRFICSDRPVVPKDICNPPADRDILRKEGWIFGVTKTRARI